MGMRVPRWEYLTELDWAKCGTSTRDCHWTQQAAVGRRLASAKVLDTNNQADLYTKHPDMKTSDINVQAMIYRFTDDRSNEAPEVVHDVNACQRESIWMGNGTKPFQKNERHGKCSQRRDQFSEQWTTMIDGLRTMDAPGIQTEGGEIQRKIPRPACPSPELTLISQVYIDVSWAHGLRQGVAMHPRGRCVWEGNLGRKDITLGIFRGSRGISSAFSVGSLRHVYARASWLIEVDVTTASSALPGSGACRRVIRWCPSLVSFQLYCIVFSSVQKHCVIRCFACSLVLCCARIVPVLVQHLS